MCLLVVASRVRDDAPLVVAANRDERLDRPAVAMTLLEAGPPAVIGGRDLEAGGTWAAVSAAGVVAALTNRPPGPRGPVAGRRSRGELPLMAARAPSAEAAATRLLREVAPGDYNGCWLLVGDRRSLWYVEIDGRTRPRGRPLPPGIHVLENAPLGAETGKQRALAAALAGIADWPAAELPERLRSALARHEPAAPAGEADAARPAPLRAPCVHAGAIYGTRSALLVTVPTGGRRPDVRFAPGPPCRTPLEDAARFWPGGAAAG